MKSSIELGFKEGCCDEGNENLKECLVKVLKSQLEIEGSLEVAVFYNQKLCKIPN